MKSTLVLIIGIFIIMPNVQAITIPLNEDFICDVTQMFEEVCYQEKLMSIPYAFTYIQGKRYSIYAESQEKEGIDLSFAYTIETKDILKNSKIQNIIEMGYPNCTPEDLGCDNNVQAYVITQIAIFDEYYHYNLNEFALKENSKIEKNFISNLIAFIKKCRETTIKQENIEVVIDEKDNEWKEENQDFLSKTYEIKSNKNLESYTINILEDLGNQIKITNEKNEKQEVFSQGELFKVFIPKQNSKCFKIQVNAKVLTTTIIVGQPFNENQEQYFFTSDTQIIQENLLQEYIKQNENSDDNNQEDQGNKQDQDSENNQENETENPLDKEEKVEQKISYQYVMPQKKENKILPQTGM